MIWQTVFFFPVLHTSERTGVHEKYESRQFKIVPILYVRLYAYYLLEYFSCQRQQKMGFWLHEYGVDIKRLYTNRLQFRRVGIWLKINWTISFCFVSSLLNKQFLHWKLFDTIIWAPHCCHQIYHISSHWHEAETFHKALHLDKCEK